MHTLGVGSGRRRRTAEVFPEYQKAVALSHLSRIRGEIAVVPYVPKMLETGVCIALETFTWVPMSTQVAQIDHLAVATTTTGWFVTPSHPPGTSL